MYIAFYEGNNGGTYSKAEVVGGQIFKTHVDSFPEISTVENGVNITEEVLDNLGISNLGYHKTEKGFQIFDKSSEDYSEENLPVYVEVFGVPTKTKTHAIIKEPTKSSLLAAQTTMELLTKELATVKVKQDALRLVEKIESNKGIAYVYCRYGILIKLLNHIPGAQILINLDSDAYIIGTKAKAEELELKVPQRYVGKAIGKNGINIKCAAQELGAKFIKVIPL